eukprot:GHVL01035172.1.p1 GENE.GHVL01035172.1~~GHVL01035172.1.p1  ORF type:complete len:508 (-),score=51.04 GHVL01035172.1:1522-3045(-)
MLADLFGYPITTANEECISAVNSYYENIMNFESRFDFGKTSYDADRSCAMALVCLVDSLICVYNYNEATSYIKEAKSLDPREALYVKAYVHWLVDNDLDDAAQVFGQIAVNYPLDLFALRRMQVVTMLTGNYSAMLDICSTPAIASANASLGLYHGILGFALDLNDRFEEALVEGRIGYKIKEEDPWSHHAVAHALYNLGALAEGIEEVGHLSGNWTDLCSHMEHHNWWHIAAFLLDMERHFDTFNLYRSKVWGVDRACILDQTGSLNILLKLVLRRKWLTNAKMTLDKKPSTHCIGTAMQVVLISAQASRTLTSHNEALFDCLAVGCMTYVTSLATSPSHRVTTSEQMPDPTELLDQVKQICKTHKKDRFGHTWSAAMEGCLCWGEERWSDAVRVLRPVIKELKYLGTSSEQTDVIFEIFIDSLLESKDETTMQVIDQRCKCTRAKKVPIYYILKALALQQKGNYDESKSIINSCVDRIAQYRLIPLPAEVAQGLECLTPIARKPS